MKLTYQIEYTAYGDVEVEAENDAKGYEMVKQRLLQMQSTGSLANDRDYINWSGDNIELDGDELDEKDMV